jgi:anti-sigma factor RsiW
MRDETMNDDRFQRLSDYLDGGLSPAGQAELERDLEADEELRTVLAELRSVKQAGETVSDVAPETDLWPDIARRIEADRVVDLSSARSVRRTFTFTVPQFAAAMIGALLMGSGALWVARSVAPDASTDAVPTAAMPEVEQLDAGDIRLAATGDVRNPSVKSDLAIAALEQKLAEGQSVLDSSTVRIIEESLAKIDRAIESATAALEADPGNMWLNRHLADSKARKLRLLEKAAVLSAVRT